MHPTLSGGESLGAFTYAGFSGLLMAFSLLVVVSKEMKTLQYKLCIDVICEQIVRAMPILIENE